MRCHNCQSFSHVRNECPSAERVEENAMNIRLTDDESSLDNQSAKSICEKSENMLPLLLRLLSGSD